MPGRLLFYVSGHGLGHAVRSAEIVRESAGRGLERIYVRTRVPADVFSGTSGTPVEVHPSAIDSGAAELGPLDIDAERTLRHAAQLLARRDEILAREVDFCRRAGITAVASDAPFLAGEVAAAAGVPCFAITNFTWDWIYEPLVERHPSLAGVLDAVREGYRRMAGWLRLPFHHASDLFSSVVDVPLVARHARRAPEEVLAALGLDPAGRRPRVLSAMRGGIRPEALHRAASGSPGRLFLDLGAPAGSPPENLRHVAVPPGMTFTDVLSVCSAAVSKLGYGTVAECIATGVGLLWAPRTGFREDQVLQRDALPYLRQQAIPRADYEAGNWAGALERLMSAPQAAKTMRTDGAQTCAGILAEASR